MAKSKDKTKSKTPPPAAAKNRETTKAVAKAERKAEIKADSKAASAAPSELLVKLPALSDAERSAFRSQYTDAECAKLGAKTQSGTVRATALAWAADIQPFVVNSDVARQMRYSASRLSWLVELVAALDVARGAARGDSGAHGQVRTTRDVARSKARAVRTELGKALDPVVRGHADDEAALKGARLGEAKTDDALVESLGLFAKLVDGLVARGHKDAETAHRLASGCVDAADAAAARAAAAGLTGARDGVVLGGQSQGGHDSPAVNLVEGRVVFQLQRLKTARDKGRDEGAPLPALKVPPSLDHVLARVRSKAAPVADPTPEPAPAAPAGPSGAGANQPATQ